MIKKIIFVLLLGLQVATAQQRSIAVTGEVTDTTGVGMVNCTVTLSGSKDGLIYSHFNIGSKNTFKVEVNLSPGDSLLVEINHLSFKPYRRVFPVAAGAATVRVAAMLHMAVQNLKQVNITPPRMWKRGDTTFYKVDQFKEGDEKKLKDMLLKLPDFKQGDDGQITYKNKPLDKITIDGEELFSDKTELLLNNFPVHVLNVIQVIENQSNQRLLKGLGGDNKTFINLQINKKNSLSAGFGEVEAGAGIRNRYNVAPVAFSIYGRIKAGFIGNYNNIGNGVGLQQEGELRGLFERDAQQLLLANHTLYHINNFEQRWYIQNRQWDNRVQINTPLSKLVRSQTEVSYVVDKQPQNTYSTLLLLDNGKYIPRIDSNTNLYKPAILSVKQTLSVQPDSVHDLKLVLSLYSDRSLGQQNTVFRGFGISSPLAVSTHNQWTSLTLSGDYTVRYTQRKASLFSFIINKENLGQAASGQSTDIAGIFALPAGYNRMDNTLQSNFFALQASWKLLLRNKNNYLTSLGLLVEHRAINLNPQLNVDDTGGNLPVTTQAGLSNNSIYGVSKITSFFTQSFKFVSKTPFLFNTQLGVVHFSPGNKNADAPFTNLLLKSNIEHEDAFADGLNGKFMGGISQWQLNPEQLYSQYYPASILSYRRYLDVGTSLRKLEAGYILSYRLPHDLTTFSVYVTGALMPNAVVANNDYKSFISFADTYILNKSTNNKNVYASISMPSLLLNAMIDFNASYSTNSFLVASGNDVSKNALNIYNLFLSFRKNWHRKYFIKFSSNLSTSINHFPANAGITDGKISALKNTFYQRLVVNKQMSIIANFNLYNNNLFTPNRANFTIADMEWDYQLKQSPLHITLRAENLFNEKNYYNFSRTIQVQSFSTIPLIGRSVFAAARYTF